MPRILLVDDDIAEISAVKRVLQRAGHQAVLATGTADAAKVMAREPLLAAIISSSCENGGGLELARRLAGEEATAGFPLLLLGESDGAPPGAVQIPRPLDPAHLAEEVQRALGEAGTALSGSGRARPKGERQAAADALLQRAEELRRAAAKPEAPAEPQTPEEIIFPWEAEQAAESQSQAAPAGPEAVAAGGGDALGARFDEELARLAQPDEEAYAAPQSAEERDAALREAEEALRLAEAEEEVARQAEAEARQVLAERAAARAWAEEEAGRRAEIEARRVLAERAAARAVSQKTERHGAEAGGDGREAEPAAPAAEPVPLAFPPDAPSAPPPEPELPAPPAELALGTLAEAPAPRLLVLAERAGLTGRIDFGGDFPRSLYFEDGRVVGATSAAPHERVEEVALRLGLVTREQHRQAAPAVAGQASRRAAMALLDRGLLKPVELTTLVRRRTEEVLFALFDEEKAPFRYEPARVPPDERFALERGSLRLAMEGVRRKWQQARLEAVLGGAATLLAPSSRAPPPDELGLGPAEQRLLQLADGLRTLDEVLDSSPLPPLETRQVLAGLLMVGALSLRFHGSAGKGQQSETIDLARVREKLDQVRRADYFAILGLSRHCTPYEVREAADRLAAEFDPGRYAAYREPGLREHLDEIGSVLSQAREILSEDRLRAEYLAGLGE